MSEQSDRSRVLLDACEPLFQHMCQLNRRLKRAGADADVFVIREQLKSLLSSIEGKIRSAGLVHLAPDVHRDLVCFADCTMRTMPGRVGSEWESGSSESQRSLSEELFEDRAFETTFIERAREALEAYRQKDDEDHRARLGVFYVCIGLGCQGAYEGMPQQIEQLSRQISAALGDLVRSPGTRLCESAYEHMDKRPLIDAGVSISRAVVLIVAAVFVVLVFIGHLWMYRNRARELSGSIDAITQDTPLVGTMGDR